MKTYITTNQKEYFDALEEIILHEKTGLIETKRKGNPAYTYMHTVIDLPGDIHVIFSNYSIDTINEVQTKNIEYLNRLEYAGTYANGKYFETTFKLMPYEYKENQNTNIQAETTAKTIKTKIEEYIAKKLTTMYPDKKSIPEKYRTPKETTYDSLEDEARKHIITENLEPKFTCYVDSCPYKNIRTAIRYEQAIANNKEEEFIRELAEKELGNKANTWCKETTETVFINSLYYHYCLTEAIKKLKENITPEDQMYLTIKEKIEAFRKEKPKAQNIKLIIQGRDSLLTYHAKHKYNNFSIENKEIEANYPISCFAKYENNQKFYSWDLEYINPKLKEQYSNRNENYLDDFLPSDIKRITYGKTVIYENNE